MRLITVLASLAVFGCLLFAAIAIFAMFFMVHREQPVDPYSYRSVSTKAKIDREMRGHVSKALSDPNSNMRRVVGEHGELSLAPADQWEIRPGQAVDTRSPQEASSVPSSVPSSGKSPEVALSDSGVRELAAAPSVDSSDDRPRYVADRSQRPQWANALPRYDDEVATVTVASGPCATLRSANEQLDAEIMLAVNTYAERTLGVANAPSSLGFTVDEIRARCLRGEPYIEHGELTGIGPMQEMFARLEFDSDFRRELGERWRSLTVLGRLGQIGYIAGGVLAAVALVWFVLGKSSTHSAAVHGNNVPGNAAPANGQLA
ncbi:MAG: hypothetical protein ACKO38_01860 [Planctomycetota bacterium]